jgi:hypothetical protein
MPTYQWISRPLTEGETEIAHQIFGNAIECDRIRILKRKFVFFQSPTVTMAPDGNIWFHPAGHLARSAVADDFSKAPVGIRAHFVHELTHVWQHQNGVNLILEKVLMFFRYGAFGGYQYKLVPGKPFENYNIEQQACIVADAYLAGIEGNLSGVSHEWIDHT